MKFLVRLMLASAVILFTACSNNQNKDRMNKQNKETIFERGEQLSTDLITGKA